MKAYNLGIQKLREAGTAKLYLRWALLIQGCTYGYIAQFQIGNLFEVVKTLKNHYSLIKLLFGVCIVIIPHSNYSGQLIRSLASEIK